MKRSRFLALLLAMVLLLSACSQPAQKPKEETEEKVTQESNVEEKVEEEKAEEEKEVANNNDDYTSLDDFVLWEDNNELIRTGRDDIGENGVVSSGKYEASKIGKEIIEKGGNAVDAAVAVGFALGLVEPNSAGLGGGGFMTMHSAKTGENIFVNFREKAPAAATPDMWQTTIDSLGNEVVIGNQKSAGGKSIGVPGTVAGFIYALENYGTMDLKTVLQPTIDLAKKGYTVTPTLTKYIVEEYGDLALYDESGDIFLKDADGILMPYEPGDILVNSDYAKTLEIIADKGMAGFYEGEVADAIVTAVNKYGGLFTLDDLKNYEVEVLEPVHTVYRGYDIYSSPSPSSGGTIIAQILNILENFDMSSYDFNSPERVQILADAFAMAYADRGEYMGDVKFVDVPMKGLLNKDYAKKLADKIELGKPMEVVKPDDPWMFEHQDTTHFSVADKEGNMVSITFTVNNSFGSKVAVPGYGFVMNDEMDDFVAQHDHPNSIAGGKTPLSSMSPTIVFKDGKPFMTLGAPGGTAIISTVTQAITNVIDYGMGIQEAVDAPRIQCYGGGEIAYEDRFEPGVMEKLAEYGYKVEKHDGWDREFKNFGSVNAIRYLDDGTLEGAGDPRRDNKALGF